jgi:hypothetical protein
LLPAAASVAAEAVTGVWDDVSVFLSSVAAPVVVVVRAAAAVGAVVPVVAGVCNDVSVFLSVFAVSVAVGAAVVVSVVEVVLGVVPPDVCGTV